MEDDFSVLRDGVQYTDTLFVVEEDNEKIIPSGRHYIDPRTQLRPHGEPPIVKPVGMCVSNYWHYVCPHCGQLHGRHKDAVRPGKPFVTNCWNIFNCKRQSHGRISVHHCGEVMRVSARNYQIILDTTGCKPYKR